MAVFEKPHALIDVPLHYCPGCTHGIVHRLVAEVIDELGIEGKTIGIAPVGCSVMAYNYFNCDMIEAAHGRAPAVATGVKRADPENNIVFTYQGDGDLASIGMAETVHAAARNENITVIFINNAIYGMTGGQMAPTSLVGQVTQTSPYGRDPKACGYPIKVCEMLSELQRQERQKREEGDQKGVPEPDRRQGLLSCRGRFLLPDQLGHDPQAGAGVDRERYAALLSSGRL